MARVNGFAPTGPISPGPLSSPYPYAARHKLAGHFIGRNRLENTAAGPVKEFVASHHGHTVITSVSWGDR